MGGAFVGPDLTFLTDLLVKIDSRGFVDSINEGASSRDVPPENSFPTCGATPSFVNAHIHTADTILRDLAYGMELDDVVGTGGLKFRGLDSRKAMLLSGYRYLVEELWRSGIGVIADFREGGFEGVEVGKKAFNHSPLTYLPFGRPTEVGELPTVLEASYGLGLSSTVPFTDDELLEIRSMATSTQKMIAVHVGESRNEVDVSHRLYGQSDYSRAVDILGADITIHHCYTTEQEILTAQPKSGIVLCPRSNAYFGLNIPTELSKQLLEREGLFCLGTDNVMTTPPNLLDELRFFILCLRQKQIVLDQKKAIKLITVVPAQVLGVYPRHGVIQEGSLADFLLWNLQSPRTRLGKDPLHNILFRATLLDLVGRVSHKIHSFSTPNYL